MIHQAEAPSYKYSLVYLIIESVRPSVYARSSKLNL